MEKNEINRFVQEYAFLSNFYPSIVQFEGLNYPTVEHAYQAAKSKEFFFRKLIVALPANRAAKAKSMGRTIRLRSDWKDIQIDIMNDLLCEKFKNHPLKTMLLETGDAKIIEGNYWHDNLWGNCFCKKCENIEGQNWLGRLIMDVRSQIEQKGNCYRRYS